jgi:hypothetical protein
VGTKGIVKGDLGTLGGVCDKTESGKLLFKGVNELLLYLLGGHITKHDPSQGLVRMCLQTKP